MHKAPLAELKAARIYFKEPAKRETRRLAARPPDKRRDYFET